MPINNNGERPSPCMQSSLIALPIVLLLLSSCALLPEPPSENATSPEPQPPPQGTQGGNVSEPTPSAIDLQWAMISLQMAESQCLSQAKAEASSAGYPSFFVSGCSCQETKSDAVKSYDCSVSAVDGSHEATITCMRNEARCLIVSEVGSAYYTFDDLEAMID